MLNNFAVKVKYCWPSAFTHGYKYRICHKRTLGSHFTTFHRPASHRKHTHTLVIFAAYIFRFDLIFHNYLVSSVGRRWCEQLDGDGIVECFRHVKCRDIFVIASITGFIFPRDLCSKNWRIRDVFFLLCDRCCDFMNCWKIDAEFIEITFLAFAHIISERSAYIKRNT